MPVGDLRDKDVSGSQIDAPTTLGSLCVLGASYRTAGLELRSKLSFSGERLRSLLDELTRAGVGQCLVLCTCNRTEVYFAGAYPEVVFEVLGEVAGVNLDDLDSHCYLARGAGAARHVFRVASGLDSAALGETEILAQLKEALRIASEGGHISGALNLLFRRALNVSKRVRTETDISRNVTSIASMAIRQAALSANGLENKKIVLLGAGAMAERLAKEINLVGACSVTVANRTLIKAQALADQYGWTAASLSELPTLLSKADVAISAICSENPIIDTDVLDARGLTIVDLGVPSTVIASGANPSVRVVNIELLAEACAANSELRASAVEDADLIVDAEVEEFARECSERDVAPAITALVSLGEHVRKENLRWAMTQLDGLDASEMKVVEDLAFRLMRGMLQGQIAAMKSDSLSLQEKACLASVFKDLCPEAAAH